VCHPVIGQQIPVFQQMRYEEDYSHFANDTLRDWYPSLKFMKIGKKAYASLGGDFRFQYLIMDNESWDSDLKDDDGYVLTRWLFPADLHLSENLRIYAELQSAQATSRKMLVPVEENPLKLHQLF